MFYEIGTIANHKRISNILDRKSACFARILTYITTHDLPYHRTPTVVSCLPSEHFCSLPACQKRLFDTLKGCRDFPCTLSLCALRRVTFPKSQNARFLRCKASYFMECPKLQKAWERHTLRCAAPMLHVACASRSAARRASALLSRQTGCCRALRRSRSLPTARHDCPFR